MYAKKSILFMAPPKRYDLNLETNTRQHSVKSSTAFNAVCLLLQSDSGALCIFADELQSYYDLSQYYS